MRVIIWCLLILSLAWPALALDTDNDGLSDDQELLYGTDLERADTDGDGFSDNQELKNGFSPLSAGAKTLKQVDTDKDGLEDDWEFKLGTNTKNPDSDSDGYLDGQEVNNGFNPLSKDKTSLSKDIKVSLKEQRLWYYFNGVELDSFLISSGVRSMPTPKGSFKVLVKYPSKNYGGTGYNFYYPNTKWNLMFYRARLNYYIHGAYWHNNFGKPMSHGCVNVNYANMERLYRWAQVGTKIVIN